MSVEQITFRASGVGNLMIGGNQITETQLKKLNTLQLRKKQASLNVSGGSKPLTAKMEKELKSLIIKRDSPFEFGETAKTFIEKEWLRREFRYEEPVVTKQMLKGHLCEQDSIDLVSKLWPSKQFRIKNKIRMENFWFSGLCDIDLDSEDTIEDVKTSWDIRTFFEVKTYPELYYTQGQVYLDLYDRTNFRLHYCLVDTPEELILEEEKKFWFRFGCDDENKNYLECSDKIRRNHNVSWIPAKQRLKTFEFIRDDKYISELKSRVEKAREYYKELSL